MVNFSSVQGKKNFLTQILIWADLIIRRPRFDEKKKSFTSPSLAIMFQSRLAGQGRRNGEERRLRQGGKMVAIEGEWVGGAFGAVVGQRRG